MKVTFRNVLAFFFARVLIMIGLVTRAKKRALKGEYILSVYFHAPDKKLFEAIIQWFLKNRFHFISVQDLDFIIKGKTEFPKGGVLLTVDDGWLTNEENIVSVADKYKVPVTIFVSTGPITTGTFWWSYIGEARKGKLTTCTKEDLKKMPNTERLRVIENMQKRISIAREAMTSDQIKKISASKYITIGAHTVTHPILTKCDAIESFNEIENSKLDLENWLQKDVDSFSFPNGCFSERELNYLKQLGFQIAFSTVEDYLTKEKLQSYYTLPRFYVHESASMHENICRMTGVWSNKILSTRKKQEFSLKKVWTPDLANR